MQRLAPVSFFLIVLLLAVFSAKVSSGISGQGSGTAQSSLAIGQVQHAGGNDATRNDPSLNEATGIADDKKLSGQSGQTEQTGQLEQSRH